MSDETGKMLRDLAHDHVHAWFGNDFPELCGEAADVAVGGVVEQKSPDAAYQNFPDFVRLVGQMTAREKQFVLRTLQFVGIGFHGYAMAGEEDFARLFDERGRAMTVREREMLRVFSESFLRVLKDMSTVVRG